jgi:hypothetical protein
MIQIVPRFYLFIVISAFRLLGHSKNYTSFFFIQDHTNVDYIAKSYSLNFHVTTPQRYWILEDILLRCYFIADIHFTFHNFFISYATHVLDSGGILCFCLCILTVLTL